jgi:hypothetical protein
MGRKGPVLIPEKAINISEEDKDSSPFLTLTELALNFEIAA